jgi:hypothetical protein
MTSSGQSLRAWRAPADNDRFSVEGRVVYPLYGDIEAVKVEVSDVVQGSVHDRKYDGHCSTANRKDHSEFQNRNHQ